MSENSLKENREQRKQKITDRIRSIEGKLPALVAEIKEQINSKRKPSPGLIFFATAPRADRKAEQETTPAVMLLRREGKGLWTCCKISIETSYLGPFDLLLDPDEWSGGFPLLLETWNTISLHEDDMDGEFYQYVAGDLLKKAEELFCAYQQSGMVPEHLRHDTGRPMEEGDMRWEFRSIEMGTIERVRLHYHEGWKKKILDGIGERVRNFVNNISVTLIPVPMASGATDHSLKLKQRQHTPLLEEDLLTIVVSQVKDKVFLRIYPKDESARPDKILIQNQEKRGEEKNSCIEVLLGGIDLLPENLDIEVKVQKVRYKFNVSFTKQTK